MVQTKRFSNTVLLSVVRRNIISFILTSVTVLSDVSSLIFHSCLVCTAVCTSLFEKVSCLHHLFSLWVLGIPLLAEGGGLGEEEAFEKILELKMVKC